MSISEECGGDTLFLRGLHFNKMNIHSTEDIWHQVPSSSSSPGGEGWMAKDDNFVYIYSNGSWKREPMAVWIP